MTEAFLRLYAQIVYDATLKWWTDSEPVDVNEPWDDLPG